MVDNKTNHKKLKKIEIISNIFLAHCSLNGNTPQRKNSKTNSWRPNNILLRNECINNEIKEGNKKVPKTNENENTVAQNLRGTAKAVLRGKFIVIQAYLKKIETFEINNLTLHLQELEQQQRTRGTKTKTAQSK